MVGRVVVLGRLRKVRVTSMLHTFKTDYKGTLNILDVLCVDRICTEDHCVENHIKNYPSVQELQ